MRRLISIAFLLLSLVHVTLFVGSPGAEGHHPFQPGEKLQFVLKYGVIPAGTEGVQVNLAVLPLAGKLPRIFDAILRGS